MKQWAEGVITSLLCLVVASVGTMLGLGVIHAHVLRSVEAAGFDDSLDLTLCIATVVIALNVWIAA